MAALILALLSTACVSTQNRPSRDQDAKNKVGKEIRRICALPEPERQARIDKIKAETGLTLACGK